MSCELAMPLTKQNYNLKNRIIKVLFECVFRTQVVSLGF